MKKKLKLAEAAEIAGLGHVEENEGEDSIVEQIRKIDHKQILTEITKEGKGRTTKKGTCRTCRRNKTLTPAFWERSALLF